MGRKGEIEVCEGEERGIFFGVLRLVGGGLKCVWGGGGECSLGFCVFGSSGEEGGLKWGGG